jgi:hypothetical protein
MFTPDDYLTHLDPAWPDAATLAAERAAAAALRTGFDRPGFALLDFGPVLTSRDFRALLVALAGELDRVYRRDYGRRLALRSAGRFDQQVTSEPHLDGGPEQSLLLLGYEPTAVPSRLTLIDYSKAAHAHGLTPKEFLARFNPMVPAGRAALAGHGTAVEGFDSGRWRALLINNGSSPAGGPAADTLGVLHQATILRPDAAQTRWVNSLMLEATDGDPALRFRGGELTAFVERAEYAAAA